jgi:hypothetical protein
MSSRDRRSIPNWKPPPSHPGGDGTVVTCIISPAPELLRST